MPRFVQILVPARAQTGYGNQRYWPIWEAAAAHGLAVAITFGGGTGTPPTPVNWLSSFFEEYTTATLNFQAHILSLAVSGLFDRQPGAALRDRRERLDLAAAVAVADGSGVARVPARGAVDDRGPVVIRRRHFRFTTQPTDAPAVRPISYSRSTPSSDPTSC